MYPLPPSAPSAVVRAVRRDSAASLSELPLGAAATSPCTGETRKTVPVSPMLKARAGGTPVATVESSPTSQMSTASRWGSSFHLLSRTSSSLFNKSSMSLASSKDGGGDVDDVGTVVDSPVVVSRRRASASMRGAELRVSSLALDDFASDHVSSFKSRPSPLDLDAVSSTPSSTPNKCLLSPRAVRGSMVLRLHLLEVILSEDKYRARLRDHLAKQYCAEGLEFLDGLQAFREGSPSWTRARDLVDGFLADTAAKQVLLSEPLAQAVMAAYRDRDLTALRPLFDACEAEVLKDLHRSDALVGFLATLNESDCVSLLDEVDEEF